MWLLIHAGIDIKPCLWKEVALDKLGKRVHESSKTDDKATKMQSK